MPGRFAFLPFLRPASAASATLAGGRLQVAYDLAIMGDGAEQGSRVPISAALRGAGDVIGISPAQIARFEPGAGQRGFEPNYFPFVEFVDADFPWRFSLQQGTPRQLSPWIALLALMPDEFTPVDQGRGPLPRLIVGAGSTSLPNLQQAWAWAHVQVNLDDDGKQSPEQAINADPANAFSRVFCCRKLRERTRYHLFVVPVYEAGRLAGLGSGTAPEDPEQLAWNSSEPGPVELPYYATSELTTDASADIEELVRRLRAFKADEGDEPGSPQLASANRPGYYVNYRSRRNQTFQIQTALTQIDQPQEPYNSDPALALAMARTLTEVISGDVDDSDDDDPLVAFPPYGFRFRQETRVVVSRARRNVWFDRLNLDLKMRHAAARGAAVIRENQELFSTLAWDQFSDVQAANQQLRQLRLAETLVQRLSVKHVEKLPPDVVTVLAESMQPYVVVKGQKTLSIAETLSKSGSPAAFASRGLRRVASKRPLKEANAVVGAVVLPVPPIQGDISASAVSRRRSGSKVGAGSSSLLRNGTLGGGAAAHYTTLFGAGTLGVKPRKIEVQVAPINSVDFATALTSTMIGLPRLKADFVIRGRERAEAESLDPIWRSPRIPVPLADGLTALDKNAILSGVGDLPDNTVSLFTENRNFIEAFMAGANHAMNDELRWREFPTDMRGTIFDRFWDRGCGAHRSHERRHQPPPQLDRSPGRQQEPCRCRRKRESRHRHQRGHRAEAG